MKNYILKPIEFKFGEYLNSGFELFKKDIGKFVLAFFFTVILSIVPFCNYLAIGNFYKFCRKMNRDQRAEASEIFNFDNFMPYFILQLIMIGAFMALFIPFSFIMPLFTTINDGSESAGILGVVTIIIFLAFFIFFIWIALKAFYIPALISLEGKTDIKEMWNISKVLTKGNLIMILLFSLVISFIGQIGVILCFIGILLTMPLYYIFNYMAFEDALDQIKKDEINEIGTFSH